MITAFSFGQITVDGVTYSNDIKLVDGLVKPEWWRKSGHLVGVEDIADILVAAPAYLVIGKGKPGYMKVSSRLHDLAVEKGIELVEAPTSQAIDTYNRLLEKKESVCAGFHVGC